MTNNKKGALAASAASGAEYLFQESEYSQYDMGDRTLSCGRKPDGFKIWLCMQRLGLDGLSKIANESMEKAIHFTTLVKQQSSKFELVNEPMGSNVCFWYIPPCFRRAGGDYTHDRRIKVHQIIFQKMQYDGTLMIQQQPLPEYNLPNFFRITFKSEKSRLEDMQSILDEIDRMGKELTPTEVDAFVAG